jgi:chitodextrinase
MCKSLVRVFVSYLPILSIAASALTWLTVPANAQTAGLVAAYGFNEGAGTTVIDTSGNGNNGTISGATWTASGKYGNALVFNGANALVTINNSASLQLSTAMTLEAWVNPSVVSNVWEDVIYKGLDNYYLEGTSGNGGVPVIGGTFGGSDVVLNGTAALSANTWSYLAATYDGTTTRLYVNGVQVASQAQTGAIATSTDALQIGGDNLYGQFFQGIIDEVRIYNVALTATQIQTDMNTPVPSDTQPPPAPTNLTATAMGGTQIELNWTASTDSAGVTNYLVERQDPGDTNFVQIAATPETTYFDAGLIGPTNYTYCVRAMDAAGNLSAYSLVASATTLPGAVASDNFNRPNGPLGTNWSKPIISTNNLVVTNDQVGVDVENSHNYAFWSATNFDDDQYSQAQITKLGAWTGVILRADSVQDRFYIGFVFAPNDYRIYSRWDGAYYSLSTGSSVTWQAGDLLRLEVRGSADPVTIIMYRNGTPVLSWVSTGSGQVKTGGNPGLGIYSPLGLDLTMDNWEAGDLPPDTQPPSAPTNLVAGALTANQIALSWQASTDNVGVLEYYVERSQGVGSTAFTQVGTATGTNYNDTGLTMSTTYNYRVRATDAAGNLSDYSGVATATTPSAGVGLVAAYGFNEGTGTTVIDTSGNGNNGTIFGATWTNSGKYGSALVFNGVNALVVVSNSPTLQLSTTMTLEAWVNPSVVSNVWEDVIYKGLENYYLEGTSGNGEVPVIGGTFGGSDVVLNGTAALSANTWSYLAATYDGTTTRLYVNGVQVASRAQTGAIMTSTNSLQIGGDSFYGQFFKGIIDEVRIYDVALTAAQIQNDMDTPVAAVAPFQISSIVQQGNDMLITWTTAGGETNVLQAANGTADGGFSNNFTDIFTVTNTVSTVTNYLDAGAATNFTARYYRVRLLP